MLKFILTLSLCFSLISIQAEESVADLKKRGQAFMKKAKPLKETDKVKYYKLRAQGSELLAQARMIENAHEYEKMIAKLDVVKPQKKRKLLAYSHTTGFRHGSIEFGTKMLTAVGQQTGAYEIYHTEDEAIFTDESLAQFDGIMIINATQNAIVSPKARAAFEKFFESKKGLIGIHAATDCHKDWANYKEAIGGLFNGHPWWAKETVTLYNECPDHACSKMIPQGYQINDEIYQYEDDSHFTREKLRILVSLDIFAPGMKRDKMRRKDNDYPVSWVKTYKNSNVFYTNLGHNQSTYENPIALQHMVTGIQFAMGDIEADTTPSAKIGKFPKSE
ncbi:putative glycosyl hydrolase (putative secreted protein) [Lentisphaera araneosa HTCC2155]|uniref:Putative glycosyl hydrolase (Putative secreted protein) n=1 Tax=Lentisphaera araneosa HTCC2155 TaxID=313628 RepID=A6DJ82_9BACT|nr:putative glycosyl hydrolase (putative secreted protein) [Lentisphaera araneosa HTCC2155]